MRIKVIKLENQNQTLHSKTINMKKVAALLFLTVYVSTAIFAEDPTDKKFHFGLKATPGLYWVKTDDETVTSNGLKFGFGYGLITEFRLAENYGFATGIELTGVGSKYTQIATVTTGTVSTNINDEQDIKLQYIQIPFTLKMKTKQIGSMKYFGQFGLGAAVNLKATSDYKITVGTATPLEKNDAEVTDYINPIRLALIVGGGIEYNLSGSTSAVASVHFDNGFLNTIRKKNPNEYDTKVFTKGIVLTIGILF